MEGTNVATQKISAFTCMLKCIALPRILGVEGLGFVRTCGTRIWSGPLLGLGGVEWVLVGGLRVGPYLSSQLVVDNFSAHDRA
jgi:hypothetical protein